MRIFIARACALGLVCLVALGVRILNAQETGGWVLLDAKATALVKQGTDAMYNLRYAEADSVFNVLVQQKPEHPAGYFLLALVDWWRIVPNSSVDTKVDRFSKSFNKRIDRVVEVCDKRLDVNRNDIIGLFFKGSALGYRARLLVLRNFSGASLLDWVSAATEGKEAYDIILRCQRLAPSNSDILLGSGLYNYLGAYIPEQYPFAKGAIGFLPPGDKKIGITMLRIAGQRATYASTEAKYSLLEVLSLWEKDYGSALQVAQELHAQYPGNSVFHRFLARNYYMVQDWANADSMYTEILRRVKGRAPGYELSSARQGLYYLGDVRLRSGNYQSAIDLFKECDKLSRRFGEDDGAWNTMATLKMGYAYDMLGLRSEAVSRYEDVLDMDDLDGAHAAAEKYLKQPYKKN